MFTLHPRLGADTYAVASLPLCELRLMNDSRFTWLILVPRRENITELHQLSETDQVQLLKESRHVAEVLEKSFHAGKLNVAALGNLVPQFHWHLVARTTDDPCWPGPVWGCGAAEPYLEVAANQLLSKLREQLSDTTPGEKR